MAYRGASRGDLPSFRAQSCPYCRLRSADWGAKVQILARSCRDWTPIGYKVRGVNDTRWSPRYCAAILEDYRIWPFPERALVFSWRQASALRPHVAVTTTHRRLLTLPANPGAVEKAALREAAQAKAPPRAVLALALALARAGRPARALQVVRAPAGPPARAHRAAAASDSAAAASADAPRAAAALGAVATTAVATPVVATTASVARQSAGSRRVASLPAAAAAPVDALVAAAPVVAARPEKYRTQDKRVRPVLVPAAKAAPEGVFGGRRRVQRSSAPGVSYSRRTSSSSSSP